MKRHFFAYLDENGDIQPLSEAIAIERIKARMLHTLLLEVELPFTTLKFRTDFDMLEFDADVDIISLRECGYAWHAEIEITAELIGVQLKAKVIRILGDDAVKVYEINDKQLAKGELI